MKKTLALALAVVMSMGLLAGCGGNGGNSGNTSNPPANNSTSQNQSGSGVASSIPTPPRAAAPWACASTSLTTPL